MSFQSNQYNGNYNNQQGGGEKKKRNFKLGKIYANGGIVEVGTWSSEKGGYFIILTIKTEIGKDPSTGAGVYQQKMNSELPSILLNAEEARAIVEGVRLNDLSNINAVLDTKRGSKILFNGSGTSVKVSIETSAKGSAAVTFEATPVGSVNVHAGLNNLIKLIEIGYNKALRNKLDPEEFSSAESDDETPF